MYRKFNNSLTAGVLLLVVLAVLVSVSAQAWPKNYRMTLTVLTDKNDELVQIFMITEREVRDLKEDSRNAIKPYLIKARKKYASDIGYRHEIYGDNNYKMVIVSQYTFEIRDKSSGRLVFEKNRR